MVGWLRSFIVILCDGRLTEKATLLVQGYFEKQSQEEWVELYYVIISYYREVEVVPLSSPPYFPADWPH